MEGSRELIVALKERGHTVVLSSSAKQDEVEHYLELLDAREITVQIGAEHQSEFISWAERSCFRL